MKHRKSKTVSNTQFSQATRGRVIKVRFGIVALSAGAMVTEKISTKIALLYATRRRGRTQGRQTHALALLSLVISGLPLISNFVNCRQAVDAQSSAPRS